MAEGVADGVQVVAEVADGDVRPEPGQLDGVAAALAPGPAGDHRHPSGKRLPVGSVIASTVIAPPSCG